MRMKQGISILATIGSVSPFIGLFGTVWGIMNSFIGIAQTRTTDLYAVAPGIASLICNCTWISCSHSSCSNL